MRPGRALSPFALALALAAAALLPAQTPIALPNGTGNLTAPAGWAVADAATRAAIDGAPHVRAEADDVVLVEAGAGPERRRTIRAYSIDLQTTAADLQTDRAIEALSSEQNRALVADGVTVVYVGNRKWNQFATGGVSLTFTVTAGGATRQHEVFVVPAGERLQYFETVFAKDDLDAPIAIARVLGTFDGAREAAKNHVLELMLVGGVVGALAGSIAARRRQRRLMAARRHADPPVA
ncbi:MAG: hypothetical protein U1E73_07065 [Planctomycetota bacterium]